MRGVVRRTLALVLFAACLAGDSVEARAQSSRSFTIAPQPLSSALAEFSRASGVQVSAPAELTAGRSSPGVSGTLSPAAALARLVAGTGLSGNIAGNTVVLTPIPRAGDAGPDAMQLPPVHVEALAHVPSTALIDNLPPPYAGGQVATGGQLGLLGNRSFMDTPFNQTSYTSKLMQDQQTKFVADVLLNDPSVNIDTGPSGGADNFVIRGFDVGNGDILFNGMAGIAPSWFNSMLSESIERVEILKGPNALLNGIGALGSLGGAINLVPKRAGDDPLTEFTADYGMNTQFGGHVDVGRRFGPNKELGVRFNGVYRNGDTAIDHQSRESRLAAFGIDYRGDRVRLSTDLGYQYQNLEGVRVWSSVAPGVPVPSAPDSRINASPPWGFVRPEVFYGVTRAEVDLTSDVTAFAAIGGNRRHEPTTYLIRSISNANGTLAPTTIRADADAMYTLSLETGLRGNFETGPVKHQTAVTYARLDVDWRSIRGSSVAVPASNIYNPVFGLGPSSIPDADSARKSRKLLFSSIGLADTLSVLNDQVQFTAGVRLQEIDAKRFDLTTGARLSRYDENAATPMFGLVVKPWSNISLYTNFIEGLQQGPVAPLGTVNAGEVFPPFVTQQYETGVKVDWGSIATTLAAYQIAKPSGIVSPTTNIFGIDGEQRHRGLELNVFGEVTDGVRLLGGATYIDSVLLNTSGGVNDGNRGPGVPSYRLVLGSEWDTPFLQGLTLWGRLIYNGSQFVDPGNTQRIPGWTRMDIGARYGFERPEGGPIIVRASIENVANSNYWIGSTYGGLTPSDPLTFKLSTTFTF